MYKIIVIQPYKYVSDQSDDKTKVLFNFPNKGRMTANKNDAKFQISIKFKIYDMTLMGVKGQDSQYSEHPRFNAYEL